MGKLKAFFDRGRKWNLLFTSRNPNSPGRSDSSSDLLNWEEYDPTKRRFLFIGIGTNY